MHKRIKTTYKISAIIIFAMCVLISGFFVYKGYASKNFPDSETSDIKILQTDQNTPTETDPAAFNNYILSIEKINLSAPITLDVDGNNKDAYNKALENGVAQLKGSAHPGQTGNAFVFGHSSYNSDKPGNYKEVFAKLNDLNLGDIIEIQSNIVYRYQIKDKRVVSAEDVTVAAQNYAIKQLTLMTCWPIGTNKERLIVVGELLEQ